MVQNDGLVLAPKFFASFWRSHAVVAFLPRLFPQ